MGKRYGSQVALEGVSFDVLPGQIFGLLGPNGSGKTTTLTCALGLLRHSSGSVHILGHPSERIFETRGRVAVVFDTPVLLRNHTILQNLTYGARLRNQTKGRGPKEVLELVGLSGLEKRKAAELSLGQMRRLSIALALAGSPEFAGVKKRLMAAAPASFAEPGVGAGELKLMIDGDEFEWKRKRQGSPKPLR